MFEVHLVKSFHSVTSQKLNFLFRWRLSLLFYCHLITVSLLHRMIYRLLKSKCVEYVNPILRNTPIGELTLCGRNKFADNIFIMLLVFRKSHLVMAQKQKLIILNA